MNSGIYEIRNLINGKRYVGSAKSFDLRWKNHQTRLRLGSHHSTHLQSAWAKYGAAAFSFSRLLICEPEQLLKYEQIAIDTFSPEYNIAKIAGNTLGTKRTAETRALISAKAKGRVRSAESIESSAAKLRGAKLPPERIAHLLGNTHAAGVVMSDERRAEISIFMTGRPRPKSAEQRAKISASLTGKKASPETRAKMSAVRKGRLFRPGKKTEESI